MIVLKYQEELHLNVITVSKTDPKNTKFHNACTFIEINFSETELTRKK